MQPSKSKSISKKPKKLPASFYHRMQVMQEVKEAALESNEALAAALSRVPEEQRKDRPPHVVAWAEASARWAEFSQAEQEEWRDYADYQYERRMMQREEDQALAPKPLTQVVAGLRRLSIRAAHDAAGGGSGARAQASDPSGAQARR